MNENRRSFRFYKESPLYQLFVSTVIVIAVGGVLSSILILAGSLIFHTELSVLARPATSFHENEIAFMRYLLVVQDISFLLIPAILILRLMRPESSAGLTEFKNPGLREIVLVVILSFCIFSVTSFTGQINSTMHLPQWLSGVEKWMTDMEEKADKTIDQLVVSNTFHIMILNLFIIALIPAVSEEMIFRGICQKIFTNLFKSGHLAIFVTAFLFSALHFQFFGFLPRFILGIVFGYLFFWSGTIWLPVLAHFINNAVPVILAYFEGMEKLNRPPDIPMWQQAIFLPLPVTISLVILFYFRDKSISRI